MGTPVICIQKISVVNNRKTRDKVVEFRKPKKVKGEPTFEEIFINEKREKLG